LASYCFLHGSARLKTINFETTLRLYNDFLGEKKAVLETTSQHYKADYPKEIDEMRKALLPVLKNAKKHKIPAAFNVDKLIAVMDKYIADLKLRSSRFTLKFCLHKIRCR